MSVAEHILVLASIIIGLAMTDLALSFHRLMRAGGRVRWHWLSPMLAMFMLLNVTSYWWASYRWYADAETVSIADFAPDLAVFLLLFLSVAAVFPDEVPEEGLELRGYYLRVARYFWTLAATNVVLTTAISGHRHFQPGAFSDLVAYLAVSGIALGACLILAFSRRIWLHTSFLGLMLGATAWRYFPMAVG